MLANLSNQSNSPAPTLSRMKLLASFGVFAEASASTSDFTSSLVKAVGPKALLPRLFEVAFGGTRLNNRCITTPSKGERSTTASCERIQDALGSSQPSSMSFFAMPGEAATVAARRTSIVMCRLLTGGRKRGYTPRREVLPAYARFHDLQRAFSCAPTNSCDFSGTELFVPMHRHSRNVGEGLSRLPSLEKQQSLT